MAMRGIASHAGRRPKALGNRLRSGRRTPGGRRKALTMSRIARGFPPTRPLARRIACPISMGHYQRDLVSGTGPGPVSLWSCHPLEIARFFGRFITPGRAPPAAGAKTCERPGRGRQKTVTSCRSSRHYHLPNRVFRAGPGAVRRIGSAEQQGAEQHENTLP